MVRHFTLTLSGSAQALNASADDDVKNWRVTAIAIQHDPANTNPVYIGGQGTLTSSDYGLITQPPTDSVPDPPVVLEPGGHLFRSNQIQVLGTAAEKLHVLLYGM